MAKGTLLMPTRHNGQLLPEGMGVDDATEYGETAKSKLNFPALVKNGSLRLTPEPKAEAGKSGGKPPETPKPDAKGGGKPPETPDPKP